MKKHPYLALFVVCIVSSCKPDVANFSAKTKNFGQNAVIEISNGNSGQVLRLENITNSNQSFKVNYPVVGYASLKTKDGGNEKSYWIYLDKDNYELTLDAQNGGVYPIKNSTSTEGKELIEFYKISDHVSKDLVDSLEVAQKEMEFINPDNAEQKARNLDRWTEKKILLNIEIIKNFAKKYPDSELPILLLDKLGRVDINPLDYKLVYDGLSERVKESKQGKSLKQEIDQSTQMMVGSKMPAIEGENLRGEKFDAKKILKKVNLFICWTSYNTKTRRDNPELVRLYEDYKNKDVEFIGVSYDKKKDWWQNVIQDDKLTWPQYSDLKGAKSPNAKNLSNYSIPYLFLTDKTGKVLMNDLTLDFLEAEINKNL
ncbi:TlpA family protein disulfide reductase [Pedobacter fastidiosus]|uniref:TlpA family protein disulfide reductase n=1 Tax=Pedobacter fastidiosus TaxID=2765361 RepID=A0ABR7KLQ9_9SPHI|nr:TlpA disulfide reductase family protein [Pedobacter fastidiosus]MBC6108909.1 TlpA family protein disulfide reductase [Pedobacter fastidiosus]